MGDGRLEMSMTFEGLESWQQARHLTFGLTFVIEDNFPALATEALQLREKSVLPASWWAA